MLIAVGLSLVEEAPSQTRNSMPGGVGSSGDAQCRGFPLHYLGLSSGL